MMTTTPLQSLNNLFATCTTLWDKIKRSNPPPRLLENMQRTFKILAEQGTSLATNATLTHVKAEHLKECATFLTTRVDYIRNYILVLGLGCCALQAVLLYNIEKNENATPAWKWVLRISTIANFGLIGRAIYSATCIASDAVDLAGRISTTPLGVTDSIKQINMFRDIFLTDVLYKTF